MYIVDYSRKTLTSFLIFLGVFIGMVVLLSSLKNYGHFQTNTVTLEKGEILPLFTTIPFVAFYLVVLLAATAGYARSTAMAEKLPIGKIFKEELQKKTMKSPSITMKIRSGLQTKLDENIIYALNNLINSRLPILAVVDDSNKVIGCVTGHDLARKLLKELDIKSNEPFEERVKRTVVEQCDCSISVFATVNDTLKDVSEKMIMHQMSKLIVVDDKTSMKFVGTVDMLDLVSEIIPNDEEEL